MIEPAERAGQGAWLHAIGMTTPLGLRAATTAAAVRAGISRQRSSSFWSCNGEPITLARLDDESLPPLAAALARRPSLSERNRRMLRLATHALREAVSPLAQVGSVPLLLVAHEPYAGEVPSADPEFLAHLRVQTDVLFSDHSSAMSFEGRAGGLAALGPALRLLHAQGLPYVLVGGVDSHVDLRLLGLLDLAGRAQASGVVDGFVPGEGAAFLLLAAQRAMPGSTAIAYIAAPGLGEERGHRHSKEPCLGDGLADAVRTAVQAAPEASIRHVFCSLNGESFGTKEWGVAAVRSSRALHPGLRVSHPADCFGDLGAATGPALVGLAALGLQQGHVAGPRLVWCASEGALRAATLVSREPVSGRPRAV